MKRVKRGCGFWVGFNSSILLVVESLSIFFGSTPRQSQRNEMKKKNKSKKLKSPSFNSVEEYLA
jgi:hypothetical protein